MCKAFVIHGYLRMSVLLAVLRILIAVYFCSVLGTESVIVSDKKILLSRAAGRLIFLIVD